MLSQAIEAIALGEFARDGYANVTIDQIANAAGIAVRTFYRYFANKEDILRAAAASKREDDQRHPATTERASD